jgi:hypothetical protein
MQEIAPAPPTLTPGQLMTAGKDALEQVIKAAVDPQYDFDRQIQLNKARFQWHMVKGNHFAVPGMVDTAYGRIADYVGWANAPSSEQTGAEAKFSYAVNLIGGDCYKFVAVMGNSAPRVKAVADNPHDPTNTDAAHNADANIRDLWVKWRADQKQRVLAFHQYATGPTYLRTPWVTDGRKYGTTVEPKINLQDQANEDGSTSTVPAEDPMPQVYENGDVELHIYTVLEIEHPYMAKSLEECPFFKCEVMRSKWDLLEAYGDILEPYRDQEIPDDDVTAASNTAAEARESVATPSGTGRQRRPNMWRFREWWLQPFLYEAITDKSLRGVLKRQYKDGLYIAKVGSITVAIDNRKLTDEWSVCKTGRGERILEDAIATDAVPLQRALDDLVNMAQETVLRSIAQTIVDSQLLDRQAMSNKEPIPGELILTALPVDGDISKRIFQIPPTRVSDQLPALQNLLRMYMQDITGIRPELAGAGAPTSTFREAKQRKDQALMQLSPQAQEMQFCWQKVAENAVRMRSKFGAGTISSPRKGSFGMETDVVDMAQLSDTGWHCESDDNFPMSESDRFDKMWSLLKEFPPEVQQALSIMDPINLEQTLELLQIPGYESVVEDHKRKTLADIDQLLQGQPVDGPPGPDGAPGPKQASIQVDSFDNHDFAAKFIQVWLVKKADEFKQTNPQGFENVQLFWQAQQQAAQPPQPPPPPPVRASLAVSGKLEDLGPDFTNEILKGAGLPPNVPTIPPPGAPAPGPAAPGPVNQQQSGGDAQSGQLPPLPGGPEPIAPPSIQ